jgi:hypothetical protein
MPGYKKHFVVSEEYKYGVTMRLNLPDGIKNKRI